MKVLIVDDEVGLQVLLTKFLESKGHEVFAVGTGDEAFRIVNCEQFDMIFSDVKMPGWNGVESVKALYLVGKKPRFVMMSAYGLEEAKKELCDYENVMGYVSKPFKLDVFVEFLDEATTSK